VRGLNATARSTLHDAGVSVALWVRANYGRPGDTWTGDQCGCPDDRCANGFHHYGVDDCGCLPTLLELFLDGTGGMFADGVLPPVRRPHGGFYRPRKLVAEQVIHDGEFAEVLVFGTHNPDLARPLADQLVEREYGSTYRAVAPLPGWWRDGIVRGERTWLTDEEHGRAAVLFRRIEETEVPGAGE
jgi:hypothetical protein